MYANSQFNTTRRKYVRFVNAGYQTFTFINSNKKILTDYLERFATFG